MRTTFTGLIAAFAVCSTTFGQCSGGRCGSSSGISFTAPAQFAPMQYAAPRFAQASQCGPNGCYASCSSGSCSVGTCPTGCEESWVHTSDGRHAAKFVGGQQIALFDKQAGTYQTFNGVAFGQAVAAGVGVGQRPDEPAKLAATATSPQQNPKPVASAEQTAKPEQAKPKPAAPAAIPDEGPNVSGLPAFMTNGVDLAQGSSPADVGPRYWIGGKIVEPNKIEGGASPDATLPDMRARPYLTVWCKDAARCKAIKEEIEACPLGKKVWVNVMSTKDWQARSHKLDEDEAFAASGVCVMLQGPMDGNGYAQVLGSEYEYTTAAALEAKIGAKIDPNYKPAKNPPLKDPTPAIVVGDNMKYGLVAGVVGLLLFAVPTKRTLGQDPNGESNEGEEYV